MGSPSPIRADGIVTGGRPMRLMLVVAAASAVADVVGIAAGADALVAAGAVLAVGVVLLALTALDRAARGPGPATALVAVEAEPVRGPAPVVDPATPAGSDAPGWRDEETGMYGAAFLAATLDARLAIARRTLRPLAIVLFEVLEPPASDPEGDLQPTDAVAVRAALTATLRESDLACRAAGDGFAILLEDTTEDGAVWTTERVRRNLAAANRQRLFRAGVASYPSHGLEAAELTSRASTALTVARDWRRDRIEVAQAP